MYVNIYITMFLFFNAHICIYEDKPGSQHSLLRREAEEMFAKAERVNVLIKANERDLVRKPLERGVQLEAAAIEAERRGEHE